MLEEIKNNFNKQSKSRKISLADLIILGGCTGIEKAIRNGGYHIVVPFSPGRTDATIEQTDIESFCVLEPKADGFRNYIEDSILIKSEHMLIDRAQLLTLTAPEMTVLLGGMRVLNVNYQYSKDGVFTNKDNKEKFICDFVKVWTKIMYLDRFDMVKYNYNK